MLEFLPFLHAETVHDLGHAICGTKVPHEIILKAEEKLTLTWIALSSATTTQLPINAARLMPFSR
jgi:hypothetical protein